MYVCLCKAVTEESVRDACRAGATTLEDLQNELGVSTGCGRCAETACCLLESEKAMTLPNLSGLPEGPADILTLV